MLGFSFDPSKASDYTLTMREQQRQEARMRDVEMLLESLFMREEVTMRLIADCLYDVGSVNLLNQRVRSKPLNKFMKVIARRSKPIFRFFMLRWSQKNAPQMITNWLHSQVRFAPAAVATEVVEAILPEVITPDAIASHTKAAYSDRTAPDLVPPDHSRTIR